MSLLANLQSCRDIQILHFYMFHRFNLGFWTLNIGKVSFQNWFWPFGPGKPICRRLCCLQTRISRTRFPERWIFIYIKLISPWKEVPHAINSSSYRLFANGRKILANRMQCTINLAEYVGVASWSFWHWKKGASNPVLQLPAKRFPSTLL